MSKKRVQKEDGRYLVYYHFAATASAEQTAAFEAVKPAEEQPAAATSPAATPGAEAPHV